jgi:hypothetical protein
MSLWLNSFDIETEIIKAATCWFAAIHISSFGVGRSAKAAAHSPLRQQITI